MLTGTIKSAYKDFGWITPDSAEDGEEVYFHSSSFEELTLPNPRVVPGARVSYRTIPTEKGPRATHVEILDE